MEPGEQMKQENNKFIKAGGTAGLAPE